MCRHYEIALQRAGGTALHRREAGPCGRRARTAPCRRGRRRHVRSRCVRCRTTPRLRAPPPATPRPSLLANSAARIPQTCERGCSARLDHERRCCGRAAVRRNIAVRLLHGVHVVNVVPRFLLPACVDALRRIGLRRVWWSNMHTRAWDPPKKDAPESTPGSGAALPPARRASSTTTPLAESASRTMGR